MEKKFAIYVRKSKMTEKGDSIKTQIDKCKAHIYSEFDVPSTDENTDIFIDEGLSGFYADRKEFTRLIKSIDNYRCLLCYRVDRVCRNTGDMMSVIDYLDKHNVVFISCSDKITNLTAESKMILKLLSVIGEFERNIITERISDNLHELAKEGRWLGGTTPLGFVSKKVNITIRGKKSTKNHLEPVESELQIVKDIYRMYLDTKSMNAVRDYLNDNGILTRNGKKHTRTSVKTILRNPVYCIANKDALDYFSEFCETIYAEDSEFDGKHGLMVYNKTDQKKEKKDDSTLLEPKFTQRTDIKPISEWIVAVGEHKGIISGFDWTRVQKLLKQNVDKYDRPKQASKSVLSGLIKCPVCGERMNVKTLSNRYTKSGDLRFNYRCRKRMEDRFGCTSKDINGNELDQFIIDAICHMNCPDDAYYAKLQNYREELLKAQREEEKEIKGLEKELSKIKSGIAVQMANLRESGLSADDKQLIWDDIHALQEKRNDLTGRIAALNEQLNDGAYTIEEIERTKAAIETFPRLMQIATYEQTIELVKKIVSFIYVKYNDATGDDEVHIVLRGAEDTVNFNLAHERSVMCHSGIDSIFHATGGIGGQPCALGGVEGCDALDQTNCADRDQVLLVGGLGIVFFHYVGHKTQVAFNQDISCLQVPFGGKFQVMGLLLGGQGFRKAACGQLQGAEQAAEYDPYSGVHRLTSTTNCIHRCLSFFHKTYLPNHVFSYVHLFLLLIFKVCLPN